jgi:DNA repair exonuclease SbcCD ATPase subunit
MGNRQLTADELERANALLEEVRQRLESLSGSDRELLFAYRRKVFKELMHDERSKPSVRRALKLRKWKEQQGLCPICNEALPDKYAVLDRTNAVDGYTAANTRLIHAACDTRNQASKGYT